MEEPELVDDARTIFAVCYVQGKIGLACFDEVTNEIMTDAVAVGLEDIEDLFTKLKMLTKPAIFVVHPTFVANQGLLDLLLADADGLPYYQHVVSKSQNWNAAAALDLLCTKLTIRGQESVSKRNTYLQLAAAIDIVSEQVKMAMGALLHYMSAHLFNMDDGNVVIAGVKPLPNLSLCRIDTNSFLALQIFAQEHHPNVIKGVGRSKEGFSLFGLFDRTKSLPGRQCLRQWMLAPFCDRERILRRQDGVALIVRPENREFVGEITRLMKHIHDIPRILLRIKKVESGQQEWCRLYRSLESAIQILDFTTSFTRDYDYSNESSTTSDDRVADRQYIADLLQSIQYETIRTIYERIARAIDFDASVELSTTTIREGYDKQLDQIRNVYDSLESYLTRAAHEV